MKSFYKQQLFVLGLVFLFVLTVASQASAVDIAVANSEDWTDVYSVMMMSSLEGQRGFFLNSDSITGFTKVVSDSDTINVYESNDPYIDNLESQLDSVDYTAEQVTESSQLNLDLDPQTGNYYVISADNPRISLSLAPLALKENAWVFIVDDENVGQIADRLDDADKAVGVGNFKRSILEEIEPTFTDRIDNDDLFEDSQEIVKRFGVEDSIVLADGSFLEVEFFNQESPVLLSGHNKILDDTYEFLEENDIKSTVIVGNKLSVIGEQIRSRSNKSISVYIKFGQSDTSNTGTVYALTMFPLPKPKLALTVEKAIYDPENQQLIARFKNPGTAGLYELSTIAVKNGEEEIASASDDQTRYLAAGETLPVPFNVSLSTEDITNETEVEFYTSFGVYPSQLDSFLTMENKFGPPFSIPLTVSDIEDDNAKIKLQDAAYYKGLNRVGVTVLNNGTEKAHVSVKVHDIIINGIEETLYKEDTVAPGKSKTLYMPASLDKVDLEENDKFSLVVMYGADEDLMLKNIRADYPFKTVAGVNTTLIVIIVIVLLLVAGGLFYYRKKTKGGKSGVRQAKVEDGAEAKSEKTAKKAVKKTAKKSSKKSSKKAAKKSSKKSSKKASKKATKKTSKKAVKKTSKKKR